MKHLNLTLLLTFCVITTLIYSVNYFFTSAIPLNGYDLLIEESSQVINESQQPSLKEKWLSLIDEKYPRQDKAYLIKGKDYYSNANLDILKETIRNLNDKVGCAKSYIANFSDVITKEEKEDKDILKEIKHDLKKEIKRNEKILAKEEKRIEKFEKSKSSAPKSILTQLLELLCLSNGHKR